MPETIKQPAPKPFRVIDCHKCRFGLKWNGESIYECTCCPGNGFLVQYASGTIAQYPGGPLRGRAAVEEPTHA